MLFTNDLSIKSLGATFNKLSEYFKLKGIKILVDSKTYLTKIYFFKNRFLKLKYGVDCCHFLKLLFAI